METFYGTAWHVYKWESDSTVMDVAVLPVAWRTLVLMGHSLKACFHFSFRFRTKHTAAPGSAAVAGYWWLRPP